MDFWIDFLKGNLVVVIMALSSLVEIAPIKVNPISKLAKWWGEHSNGDVIKRVDKIEQDVAKMKADNEERDIKNSRTRILRFADECQNGQLHSREHWDQTMRDITAYELYCATHSSFQNEVTVETIHYLKDKYRKHMAQGDWL